MEQHKLREKLQNRSIVPSKNSWDQLSQKLDTEESTQKTGKWWFLKYAAIFLMFFSVGLYFFKTNKPVVEVPVVVAPTLKEEVKKTPEIVVEPEIRVAETTVNSVVKETQKKQPIILKNKEVENVAIAIRSTVETTESSKIITIENTSVEIQTEEILVVEQPSEEEILNAEVEHLLNASKIKLRVNHQISKKRGVSASSLLADVEDDLDKDFKEKLVEKIITTLKTPRKIVITDRGD
ncbi:hypothetical protein ACFQ5N_04225 [Lutibacter holmesii]|uniref:Uncharacterized protein n=1 Tax=Lutibacter holmesii TaxID=1137985 RepID=A0ABW3WM93_9FLAO